MKMLLTLIAALALAGCGVLSENVITDIHGNTTTKHGAFLAAQVAAIEAQKPILELEASGDEPIVLAGIKALRVYGPQASASEVKPYVSPGYALAQNLVQTALFPFFSWAIFREAANAYSQPTVVQQPAPLIVNPQIVEPTIVQIPTLVTP